MMLRDKKFNKFLLFCVVYILLTALFLILKKPNELAWFSRWFFDKFFVFQFSIIYLLGCSMIEKYFNYLTFNRIGNRKKILVNQLVQQYSFAFIFTNILFTCIILGAVLMFGKSAVNTIPDILDWYLRYLLGLFMLTNLSMIFSRSEFKILSVYSHFCAFLILSLELISIIPGIKKLFSINIHIMFSWIFYENALVSYFFLVTINLILAVYLFLVSNRKDLFA